MPNGDIKNRCSIIKGRATVANCQISKHQLRVESTHNKEGRWVTGAYLDIEPKDSTPGKLSQINNLGTALYQIYLKILNKANPLNPQSIASVDLREFVDKNYTVSNEGILEIPSFNLVKEVLGVEPNEIVGSNQFDEVFLESRYQTIYKALDERTSSTNEKIIIDALSDLEPDQFLWMLKRLASKTNSTWRGTPQNLLEFLYTDIDGDNSKIYLQLYRIKVMAIRAGSPEKVDIFYNDALAGENLIGSFHYRTGFKSIRNYPSSSIYELNGDLRSVWNHHEGIFPPWRTSLAVMQPTDIARINYGDNEPYVIITAPEMHALAKEHLLNAWIDKLSIITIVSGISSVAVVRTVTGRITATVLGVVFPAADIVIREYRKEIEKMENGLQFLRSWEAFNYALLGFGVIQLVRSSAKMVFDRIKAKAGSLKARNIEDESIIKKVTAKIDDINISFLKKKAEIDLVKSRVDKVPAALRNTVNNTHVYLGIVNGEIRYVGITVQDLAKRQAQHIANGKTFTIARITESKALSRRQARAIEQAIINKNKIDQISELGGIRMFNVEFANEINSIAKNRSWYQDGMNWAGDWLKLHNYL
jgi:hypothetical protein